MQTERQRNIGHGHKTTITTVALLDMCTEVYYVAINQLYLPIIHICVNNLCLSSQSPPNSSMYIIQCDNSLNQIHDM